MTSIGTLMAFTLVCAAVLVVRRTMPDVPRSFKPPLVPLIPISGILTCLCMMLFLPADTWIRKEKDEQITLGFLDIDHFKDFNTYFGHQVGDKVLQFVSAVLKEQLKGEIGRVGGDEFIFCFVGKKRKDEIEKEMNRLLQLLKSGFYDKNSQQTISVSCSIGIAIMKGKDADYTELIRLGDKSMYEAKDAGRNSFIINELD